MSVESVFEGGLEIIGDILEAEVGAHTVAEILVAGGVVLILVAGARALFRGALG